MKVFLIADRTTEELETVVFSGDGGDVVAMFTESSLAQEYIDHAGWGDKFTVASLLPIDFLEWLIACYRNGVRYLATDPDRRLQDSGKGMDTLDIQAHLEHAADHITAIANPEF